MFSFVKYSRKLVSLIAVILTVFLVGCSSEEPAADTYPAAFVGTWHLVSMSNAEIDAMLTEYGLDMADLITLMGGIEMSLDGAGGATFSADGVETTGTWVGVDATHATLLNYDGEQIDVVLQNDQLVWEVTDDEFGAASMVFARGPSPS